MKLSTNEVTLIGFVGGDAKQKETKNHNRYAVVNMATNESWKDKQTGEWTKRSTWHRLVSLGKRKRFNGLDNLRVYEITVFAPTSVYRRAVATCLKGR